MDGSVELLFEVLELGAAFCARDGAGVGYWECEERVECEEDGGELATRKEAFPQSMVNCDKP